VSTISVTTMTTNLLPMFHASALTDLVWWSNGQIGHWFADWIKRHAQEHGGFVSRGTIPLVISTATYSLPTTHLDTIHAALDGTPLVACSTSELDGLDDSYSSTTGTPTRWYVDRINQNKIGVYPVPIATGTLEVIYHSFPCDLTSGFLAPVMIGEYLELAVLAEAYDAESDGQMTEIAIAAREMMRLIDGVVTTYYGRSQ
jgi:hypothetical protein